MEHDHSLVAADDAARRFKRQAAVAVAGAALFALLGFGAAATTLAADPSPSPSPSAGAQETAAPDGTNRPPGAHRGGTRADCREKQGQGGGDSGESGGSGDSGDDGSTPSPVPSDSPEA